MKCFVVGMMFLSEWGERLINPYKANSNGKPIVIMSCDSHVTNRAQSSDSQTVLFRRSVSSKNVTETEKPVNYAVITLRDKIRVGGANGVLDCSAIIIVILSFSHLFSVWGFLLIK